MKVIRIVVKEIASNTEAGFELVLCEHTRNALRKVLCVKGTGWLVSYGGTLAEEKTPCAWYTWCDGALMQVIDDILPLV
jgi:hypothetical protein